jgi:hypothetical protein
MAFDSESAKGKGLVANRFLGRADGKRKGMGESRDNHRLIDAGQRTMVEEN